MTSRAGGTNREQGTAMRNEPEVRIGTILIPIGSESIALALATARSVDRKSVV